MGETGNFDMAALRGVRRHGIVVVDDAEQAASRVGSEIDRGSEFAEAAITMGNLGKKWKKRSQ